jgi:hypothetical protein
MHSERNVSGAPQLLGDAECGRRTHFNAELLGALAHRAHRSAVGRSVEREPQQRFRAVPTRGGMLEDLPQPRRSSAAGRQLQEQPLGVCNSVMSVALRRRIRWEPGGEARGGIRVGAVRARPSQ